jgi:hypothetical protein
MMDEQTQAVLQEALRRESLSELLYVGQAYPWTSARDDAALADLEKVVKEEAVAVAALGRWLTKQRVPVAALGPFPTRFTTLNFLALEHVLPLLVGVERRLVKQLEADLTTIHDPAARAEVQKLLTVKRQHLPRLEALAEQVKPPASA